MASGQPPFAPPPPPPSYAPPPGDGAPPGPPPGSGLAPIPWEDRARLGFVPALVENVKLFVSSPSEAFRRTRECGDLASPVLYAVIIGFVGHLINQVWNYFFGQTMLRALVGLLPPDARGRLGGLLHDPSPAGAVVAILLAPIFTLVGLFIYAAILHVCLLLVGGLGSSRAGFEGTLRVLAYASIANLAALVPVVGGVIGLVWVIVLEVIGLSVIHRTSQGKAVAAVLIPVVLCCLCCVGLAALFAAGLGAALSNMGR